MMVGLRIINKQVYGVNANFSRPTSSLVLGLSLISHTSFAFIDASAYRQLFLQFVPRIRYKPANDYEAY